MISKSEMMGVLLDACPSFEPAWRAFVQEWAEEDVERPDYVALGQLSRVIVRLLERREKKGLDRVFEAIERLIVEGDDIVQKMAIIGILENLQNSNLHSTTEPEMFEVYLGIASRRWWTKLERFWAFGEILMDD